MTDLEVRDLSLDDRAAALAVRHRSFGPLSPGSLDWWNPLFDKTVDTRRALGVYDGDQLVGMGRIHGYQQLWGGRAVPMAGVAGVIVAPEYRGRGAATRLMRGLMARALELGDVVSVLFPATMPPYRRIGFEVGGSVFRTTFPAAGLRAASGPQVAVRRPTADDAEAIADLLRRVDQAERKSGPLALSADDVRELLNDDENIWYLAADGVVVYAWDGKDIRVERLAAESAETTRALWSLVGSGASAVRHVYSYLPLHDPVHWLVDEKAHLDVEQERWMIRIIDARGAIERRSFPSGVTVEIPLRLHDPWLDGCTGAFRLTVADGRGQLADERPSGTSQASLLGPNAFAALYAGTPMATLRRAGLVRDGSADQDAALDAAFAAHAYLLDSF